MRTITGGARLGVAALAAVLASAVLTTPASAAAPPFDPSLGRTPYQPDKMLVDPYAGDARDQRNQYGFNLTQYRGLANPAYYELMDHYTVKLYRNRRGLPENDPRLAQEERWLEGFDEVLSTMVLETNKWVGGRLEYLDYDGEPYLTTPRPANQISITFDPQLTGAVGIAYPGSTLDRRGLALTGGNISFAHLPQWTDLVEDSLDGDREARYQIALKVMHEFGHHMGLNHYFAEFHGQYTLMGGRTADDVTSWNQVLSRGDKAGLLAMAGWRDRAKKCGETGVCDPIWYKDDGVAWPPNAPDHRYDRG
ncbi:hypothetical protein IOD16_01025 [Saccharothrix sp. 6-C]|uniref:hypothetical protein n=1 Tax=Saccharothrix sp. 6-C TaxID=2781735 RepID=UPI0019179F79|nr:hypothetical protein [Saccharothrix sp. 6-C]QQQ77175.1 hypothetical protein IOD16_01025 [Saccharothrix sp. 6-C]